MKKLEDHLHSSGPTASLVIETQMTLVNWLIRHIGGTDKELASFLALEGFSFPEWDGGKGAETRRGPG